MKSDSNPGYGLATINKTEDLIPFLDPEISDLIIFLRNYDFDTFTSCSGQPGHAFNRPTVRMCLNSIDSFLIKEKNRLHILLRNNNYYKYVIRHVYDYHSGYNLLELEFYSLEDLKEKT